MKLEWLFGSSMAQHHLLWAYISVWVIQGGYAVWIALQWKRTRKHARPAVTVDSVTHEDS
jgi:hypothetical protein